jgi:hypothetical protein
MDRKGYKHSTIEDEAGWKLYPTPKRNLLNKSAPIGSGRKGTLGRRLTSAADSTKWVNPRIGKVQPPAPLTKRVKPTLEYVMGDTSMGAAVNLQDGKTRIVHEWRGTVYPTWEAMNQAIEDSAK